MEREGEQGFWTDGILSSHMLDIAVHPAVCESVCRRCAVVINDERSSFDRKRRRHLGKQTREGGKKRAGESNDQLIGGTVMAR